MKRNKCTSEAMGVIVDIKSRGLDSSTIITVKYQANDNSYTISEAIKLKSELIKIGFIPIGQKKVPVMKDVRVGTEVIVRYSPDNPSEAYLRDNIGLMNV